MFSVMTYNIRTKYAFEFIGRKKKDQTVEVAEVSSSKSTSNVPAEQSSSLTSESTTAPSQIHENPPIPDLIPDEVHNYAPKKEPGETSKTPPVNFIMTDVGTYKRSSTTFWMSTPFRSHQLGYKLYPVSYTHLTLPTIDSV